MKRYLNIGFSGEWIGLAFGQECRANEQSVNGNTEPINWVLSFKSSIISQLSEQLALGLTTLITQRP